MKKIIAGVLLTGMAFVFAIGIIPDSRPPIGGVSPKEIAARPPIGGIVAPIDNYDLYVDGTVTIQSRPPIGG